MSKTLIAYFSVSGNTRALAGVLGTMMNADVFEIRPEVPYTDADVRYTNPLARCNKEKIGRKDVAIAETVPNFEDYDMVYLGFPIWYYGAPNIIQTFCSSYDWTGKKVALFATSGGSNLGSIDQELQSSVPRTCTVKNGRMLNGRQKKDDLAAWVRRLHL